MIALSLVAGLPWLGAVEGEVAGVRAGVAAVVGAVVLGAVAGAAVVGSVVDGGIRRSRGWGRRQSEGLGVMLMY